MAVGAAGIPPELSFMAREFPSAFRDGFRGAEIARAEPAGMAAGIRDAPVTGGTLLRRPTAAKAVQRADATS